MDSHDYSSCGADVSSSTFVGEGIGIGCLQRSSSTVAVTILLRLFTVQAARALDFEGIVRRRSSNIDPHSS